VLPESALRENEPQRVSANGVSIVLVRNNNRVHALLERCSHMGGPLAEGAIEQDTIRCPWHGSRFSLEDGSVVEGPATIGVGCFEARVINGWIHVRSMHDEAP
jgi:nitrite reductase/ring-hydroxylating ferredoxin subunit